MMNLSVRKLVLSAMFLSLCMVLPFLTGQIPEIGSMLLPMHLPVLIAGFVLGAPYAGLIGFIAPLLRSAVFGMPPPFPAAPAMAVEMLVYGFACGIFYRLFPKKSAFVYASLVISMIIGRIAMGATKFVLLMAKGNALTMNMFFADALINAWPGIVLQLILVPVIVIALERAKLIKD